MLETLNWNCSLLAIDDGRVPEERDQEIDTRTWIPSLDKDCRLHGSTTCGSSSDEFLPELSVWWAGKHWIWPPHSSELHWQWKAAHARHNPDPTAGRGLAGWTPEAWRELAGQCSPSAGLAETHMFRVNEWLSNAPWGAVDHHNTSTTCLTTHLGLVYCSIS